MNTAELLAKAVAALKASDCKFAIAGGFAANLYRRDVRVTEDIDFGIVAPGAALDIAKSIWQQFNISGKVLTRKQVSPAPTLTPNDRWMMVADRDGERRIDFMLSQLDWVTEAVERAQSNVHPVSATTTAPFLTLEDVIVAKAFAVHHAGAKQDPYKHMSDIQDILTHNEADVDLTYLTARLASCKVGLPSGMKQHIPARFHALAKVRR